jgi:hypothetical protein
MNRRHQLFIGVLVTISMVNLIQFRAIDDAINTRYSALNRDDTSDIIEIGETYSPHFTQAYGLHLTLAKVAPGARVIMPSSGPLARGEFHARLLSFGRAESAVYKDYDYDVNAFLGNSLAVGTFHDSGYQLLDNFDLVANYDGSKRGKPWSIFMDERLRDDKSSAKREFISLIWDLPDSDYRILLIETSLLPKGVQKESV